MIEEHQSCLITKTYTTATFGSMESWRILAFLPCSLLFKTAFLVVSLPVPEVVGTAIKGAGGCVMGNPWPKDSTCRNT